MDQGLMRVLSGFKYIIWIHSNILKLLTMLHNFHPVQGYSRNDVLMYRTHFHPVQGCSRNDVLMYRTHIFNNQGQIIL